ncbi:MAG: flagellar brake protein [Telluria sp.]|nr:flagellar brake protein [Telluria sp.]
MTQSFNDSAQENWHDFQVESRREIISLLRGIGEKNQLIRLLIQGEADVALTSVLDVDGDSNTLYLDCPIDKEQNRRIVGAKRLSYETTLDKIRILFASEGARETTYKNLPALKVAIPASLIRLQRREYYRMATPVSNPVCVTIPMDGVPMLFPLADISCGGIAILDHKLLLGNTIGNKYEGCKIELPDAGPVTSALQVRNLLDLTLLNNKTNRRVGCEFVDISRGNLANVQRYITKLERERNARLAGLG